MAGKVKTALNAIFAWAAANDLVQVNPVLAVKGALPKAGGKVQHHRALAWEEVPAMLATISESGAKVCYRMTVTRRHGRQRPPLLAARASSRIVNIPSTLVTRPGTLEQWT